MEISSDPLCKIASQRRVRGELTCSCSVCPQVQLQLLTAIVKLFLKKPTETQELVQQVLSLATQVGTSSCTGPSFPRPVFRH